MEKVFKERFGERLKERRLLCGFKSGNRLAEQIGITPQSLNNYENGKTLPDAEILCKLSTVLGCTVDYLTMKEDAPTHEAASIADQTGLPASMIADLQRDKKDIDFLEAREKSGLPTDYPFEFEPGDPDFRQKAREIATPCFRGQDARIGIAFLFALWEHSDITDLGRRFFEWENAIVQLSKADDLDFYDSRDKKDNVDLKRYRIIRFIEQFLHDYEWRKTGRDEYEEDW